MRQDAAARVDQAPRLVFFDLDGTVARRDTLLPYVARDPLPRPWRWWRLAGVLAPALGFAVGRGERGALKGALIHAALGGASSRDIEDWNTRFLPYLSRRAFSPSAVAAIAGHRRQGDYLVLMSASVDLYVPEIGRRARLQRDDLQRRRVDGRSTGRAIADGEPPRRRKSPLLPRHRR